jgi:putative tricarboxylic transport membrane protein
VTAVLSLLLIYRAVKGRLRTEYQEVVNPQNLWVTMVAIIVYVSLLETVGFVVLTPIWIALYMIAIGARRWTWLLGTTVVFSGFLIVVFPTLMQVPLPRGTGIFRQISLLFY